MRHAYQVTFPEPARKIKFYIGNVLCSRGSVIPLWIEQIRCGKPITVTEPSMTRFIMSPEETVDLVLHAFENAQNGDILVQKASAVTIQTLAEAVRSLFGSRGDDIRVIGRRHGETMHETLLTREERAVAEDMGDYFRIPVDRRDLNDDMSAGYTAVSSELPEFASDGVPLLTQQEVQEKIALLPSIRRALDTAQNDLRHLSE